MIGRTAELKGTTMTQLITDPKRLKNLSNNLGLIPTMGNLHEGHLSLIKAAQERGCFTLASIFVNPKQFGPNEDFATYPRTLEKDCELLESIGTDVVFAPNVETMYPNDYHPLAYTLPDFSNILEGAHRPGFFQGVCEVVYRLFDMVKPQMAFFGEKDFQQLLIIRTMVQDLKLPIDVVGLPTMREANHLAMSSRNNYLSLQEKRQAACIYQALNQVKTEVQGGARNYQLLCQKAKKDLELLNFSVDYFTLCRQQDLAPAALDDQDLVLLCAASLGTTRLIDNILI